jgi:hypothetical protein
MYTLLQISSLVQILVLSLILDRTARQMWVRSECLDLQRWGTFVPMLTNIACISILPCTAQGDWTNMNHRSYLLSDCPPYLSLRNYLFWGSLAIISIISTEAHRVRSCHQQPILSYGDTPAANRGLFHGAMPGRLVPSCARRREQTTLHSAGNNHASGHPPHCIVPL